MERRKLSLDYLKEKKFSLENLKRNYYTNISRYKALGAKKGDQETEDAFDKTEI